MKKTALLLTLSAALLAPAFASAQTAAPTTKPATAMPAKAAAPGTMKMDSMKKLVHINSANTVTLMTLPGVGKVIAAEIIKNRPYKSAADLTAKVKGLGSTSVQKLLPLIDFK